jgi:hypothetical protein
VATGLSLHLTVVYLCFLQIVVATTVFTEVFTMVQVFTFSYKLKDELMLCQFFTHLGDEFFTHLGDFRDLESSFDNTSEIILCPLDAECLQAAKKEKKILCCAPSYPSITI